VLKLTIIDERMLNPIEKKTGSSLHYLEFSFFAESGASCIALPSDRWACREVGETDGRTDGQTSGQTGGRLAPPNPNEMPE